jgi:hypothetical protein
MGINSLIENAATMVKANPITTAIGVGAVGLGAGITTAALIGSKTKKKTRKSSSKRRRISHTKRGWKQDRKRSNKSQKWEVAYRKRKKMKSKRRGKIHYARKTGQPYIILASGKAKFIKGKRRK